MQSTPPAPLTPIRTDTMSPVESPSPTHAFRDHLRRRTSSFSSNHDRSPLTPRSSRRFSHVSRLSGEFGSPVDEGGKGGALGNLADELDQLDDDDEFAEGETLDTLEGLHAQPELEEASRDSGIDVSYKGSAAATNRPTNHVRNFSKPFTGTAEEPPDEVEDENEEEDRFTPDLEDLMHTIARMTSYTSAAEDPLIPRTIALLQDLGNQTSLEAATQRYTTSTNSLTVHLANQSKSLQTLVQTLYPMFAFTAPLDPVIIEETLPLVEALSSEIPQPDVGTLQKLQKLDRETADVVHSLAQLTDTLQMGKQSTAAAARHLRSTQTMIEELRLERERADLARHELAKSDWEDRLRTRWCGTECKDIISGFEDRCNALRGDLEQAIQAGA
ncbi:hypothetical protein DOTSEDRAFT_68383 [Dothistroma septosporum NZE10]|uniref:Uncharacterized protein n=1 Tax=Dothistroma septosporum (strain NZE10 / CBS 128990) TaxID=675120 RepID=N1Q4M2_DOTSN|nr:hypothetical protein DOTSEDRAFT_68383 [Dothistroma septosporum NZE10]